MLKSIAALIDKGGVGKTSLSIHLAAALAIRGYTVLLIDADPQANLTHSLSLPSMDGLNRILNEYEDEDGLPIDDAWSNYVKQLDPERWAGESPKGQLWVLPGHIANRGIAFNTRNFNRLRERQAELEGIVDIVVYDTPPTVNALHSLIYRAATHIFIPTQLEEWSRAGVRNVVTKYMVEEHKYRSGAGLPDLKLLGIQPTMAKRSAVHEDTLYRLQEQFGQDVWEPITDRPTRWGSAVKRHKTIFANEPHCAAEDEIWRMADNAHRILLKEDYNAAKEQGDV